MLRQIDVVSTGRSLTESSDLQLLGRFVQTRDEAGELAFSELIHRHGPMVRGVCRQILRHEHDADDAFQATFLILVRKARSIRTGHSLAPWLYSVAYRTAQRARATATRHRPGLEEPMEKIDVSSVDTVKGDIWSVLYQELGRLPVKYRAPIVLCHLEGKTHEEAARLLVWPVGTVSGRLSRGRQLLRARLERRGVAAPSAIWLAPWLLGWKSVVTTSLVGSTIQAATRFAAAQSISVSILSLTQGVLRTMFLRKLSMISLAVLAIGAISGAGVWAHRPSPSTNRPAQAAEALVVPAQDSETTPASKADLSLRSQPQPADGSQSRLAENCPAECPLTSADTDRPYCPISMAAATLRGLFGHVSESSVTSR
jgi:RNA polymerase sigma factor (sigma-70 family)